jgi:hypothetical protein
VLRLDALIEQPAIAGDDVVDRPRMHVLRGAAVVDDQRAATDRLGEVPVHLAMGVHRACHVAAAVSAEQHAILGAALGRRPQRRHAAGGHLDIVDAAGFGGHVAPVLEHAPHLVELHVRVGGERRHPALVECLQLLRLLAGHRALPHSAAARRGWAAPR